MKKTIGILGGMGPEATVHFFNLIVKGTAAARDQDHVPIIIYNLPQVPERTAAILGEGPSPVPLLREGIRRLARAGADFIVIPCVTAHAFIPKIKTAARIPILSLVDEALSFARKKIPGLKRAGLLASTGTVRSGLWQHAFAASGVEIITPMEKEQAKVMEAVFGKHGIKAGFTKGRPRTLVVNGARRLIRQGAQAIIAGCTEIPLVLKDEDIPVPLIEPMRIGARASILKAGYKPREQ
ncbi:MAG: amino acid racemase [Candidatus Aminicenantales bacterium]